MCCLFGFVDYTGALSVNQKNRLIRKLSIAAEACGTDATGIAYNTSRGLQIYKRPLAAHRLHLRIPAEAHVVSGHTRMTTQGSAKKNFNNHPFFGHVKGKPLRWRIMAPFGTTLSCAAQNTCREQRCRQIVLSLCSSLSSKNPSTFPACDTQQKQSRDLFRLRCCLNGMIYTSLKEIILSTSFISRKSASTSTPPPLRF